MVITEFEYKVPDNIRKWAEEHDVPIVRTPLDFKKIDAEYIIEYSEDRDVSYLDRIWCHSRNIPAVIGETERLIIKEIGEDDIKRYRELILMYRRYLKISDMAGLSFEEFKVRHEAYIRYSYQFLEYGIYGIYLKTKKEKGLIGIAGIDGTDEPELSYALYPEYREKGYAFEACEYILRYVKENELAGTIHLYTDVSNSRSFKLGNKLKKVYPELVLHITDPDGKEHNDPEG